MTQRVNASRSQAAIATTVIAVFLFCYQRGFGLFDLLGLPSQPSTTTTRLIFTLCWYIVPSILTAALLFGPKQSLRSLGLGRGIGIGLLVGGACTSLMLIGYAMFGSFDAGESPLRDLFVGSVLPGVGEEILYRGLLFGILFRFAGWGFVPASLLGAIVFGAAHMFQGQSIVEVIAIVSITGMGAIWFAWLYAEWDYNLWVPITLHVLMNAYWGLFAIDGTALGDGIGNLFRIATIASSVVVTVMMTRRRLSGSAISHRLWRSSSTR